MKKVFNLIVLDESGSMQSIKNQAISGINETIQSIRSNQQQYENQCHFVTLVSFNSNAIHIILEEVEIDKVQEITPDEYNPNACTPLNDAIGESINRLSRKVSSEDMVVATIITDGLENASKEYSPNAIKNLINEKENCGWHFVYIGANQDAIGVAKSIGIKNSFNFVAEAKGMAKMFKQVERVNRCCGRMIAEGKNSSVLDECIDEIRRE